MRTAIVSICVVILGGGGCGGAAKPAAPTTTATNPDDADGPWGAPVPAPEIEARVKELLVRMRDGKLEKGDLDTAVAFGAGLWSSWQLAGLDSSEGIPFMTLAHVGDRQVIAHGRAIRFAALAPFMASKPVTMTASFFADGEVGPASAFERRLYQIGIAWKIKGEPVTVVRKGGEVLVVALSQNGTIFELELLGPWYRLATGGDSEIDRYQPTNTIPGVP